MSDSGSLTYDNLIAGSQKQLVTRPATFRNGEALSRGTLVGKLTATQKWQTIDFDDKSNFDEYGIATQAIDSTEGEVVSDVFVEGEFAEGAVIIGYGDDADDWRQELADSGIYLRKTVSTAGV